MTDPRCFTITLADITRCPRHSLLPAHYRDDGVCACVAPPQEPSSVRITAANGIPSAPTPEGGSGRPVAPSGDVTAIRLSDPQQNALMELARIRHRHGPNVWGGSGWGNTLQALARRGLAETRTVPGASGGEALHGRITDAGAGYLLEQGIACR